MGRAWDGMLAAGALLAGGELAAALLPGARSPVTGTGRTIIDLTPGPVVDMTVATAEAADKVLLEAGLVGEVLALGATAADLSTRRPRAGTALLAGAGLTLGAAAATRPDAATRSTLAAGAVAAAAGSTALRVLTRAAGGRVAVRALAAAATGAALLEAGRRRREQERAFRRRRAHVALPVPGEGAGPVPDGADLGVAGISPLFTPPGSFYITDVQLTVPQVDPDAWRLRIGGLVERPVELSLPEVLGLGLLELDATLACVHNPPGGPRIGSARWTGVPLAELLDLAGPRPEAQQLLARSVDGFTAGVPLERIRSGIPAILAVGMGGAPLPPEHGFPARLLLPGLWGADANTKWVAELEVTTWAAARDYWDRRGWPREPTPVRPGSRIDVPVNRAVVEPGAVTVAGVAWAPPDGVAAVEVSVDGGPWAPAELGAEVAPTFWRQWRATPRLPAGVHDVRVRARGRAAVQDGDPAPPYPSGASGYHAVRVTAAAGHGARTRATPRAALDDAVRRARLASMAPPAWRRAGFPPVPRWPDPATAA